MGIGETSPNYVLDTYGVDSNSDGNSVERDSAVRFGTSSTYMRMKMRTQNAECEGFVYGESSSTGKSVFVVGHNIEGDGRNIVGE